MRVEEFATLTGIAPGETKSESGTATVSVFPDSSVTGKEFPRILATELDPNPLPEIIMTTPVEPTNTAEGEVEDKISAPL
jgi:hypothetical protein